MNVSQLFITCKRTNNTNNATHYVKPGKKRRKSSKRNYHIISPRVIIKAIIIIWTKKRNRTKQTSKNAQHTWKDLSETRKLAIGAGCKKMEFLVQNQSFWNIVGVPPTAVPRNSGRDNTAGIMIIWWTNCPRILQIHSLHQFATVTPFHISVRRRGIIIPVSTVLGPIVWSLITGTQHRADLQLWLQHHVRG